MSFLTEELSLLGCSLTRSWMNNLYAKVVDKSNV